MFQMTQNELVTAYVEARQDKVPLQQQGTVERSGYFLLKSVGASGDPCLERAIARALHANEVDVAVGLANLFIPEIEIEADPRYRRRCNGNFASSGELVAR